MKKGFFIEIDNKPGALFNFLEPFAKAGTNITYIQSHPTRQHEIHKFFICVEEIEEPDPKK